MGNKRRCTALDWIFNPMGMGKKRCALFNPMVMSKRRRCGIFNPILRSKKRCGDGDGDGDGDGKCNGDDLLLLLPEDVLIKILVCLPVKSLLLYKSVCKSWRQLIESSFFIDLHTTTLINSSSKFGAFIIQTSEPSNKYEDNIKLFKLSSSDGDGTTGGEYDEDEVSSFDGDGTSTTGGEDDDDGEDDDQKKKKKKMVVKVDDLRFLPFYKDYLLHDTLRMVGSCNGIICLHDTKVMEDYSRQDYPSLRDVCLWNPATRQFRILPKSIPIEEKHYITGDWLEDLIALGFDLKTKDYKVLRITRWRKGEECMCGVQVYSLSTDSWRLLEGINSLPGQVAHLNHGIYLNGSYFFVGRRNCLDGVRDDFMLWSFDFTKEIFNTIDQLPETNSRYSHIVLSSLGGKMALFEVGYKYYDIWVLNNEEQQHGSGALGVLNKESSWTKLHSNLLKNAPSISNNGEFSLISTMWGNNNNNNNKLKWLINLVTKEEAKNDFTIGSWGIKVHRADVYKESLVSIMGGGNVLLRWQLPTHGTTYKLNLDAPFIDFYRPFGIGLCLTSDAGGCIGVRSLKSKRYVRDAEEGEAMAMLEAIEWAKELKLSPIIIQSDSKNVVSFFMDDDDNDDDDSKALSLLREAKLLLNSSELGISLKYCYRSCNYVADIAAKLARERLSWTCMDWTAKFPGEMVRSLSKKDFASKTW